MVEQIMYEQEIPGMTEERISDILIGIEKGSYPRGIRADRKCGTKYKEGHIRWVNGSLKASEYELIRLERRDIISIVRLPESGYWKLFVGKNGEEHIRDKNKEAK